MKIPPLPCGYEYVPRPSSLVLHRSLLLIVCLIILQAADLQARDAPVTTAGSVTVCPGDAYVLPVTATGFSLVTAITLRIDFNHTEMTYGGYLNLNPSLPGMVVNVVNFGPDSSKVLVAWTSIIPVSLPNGSKFFDLQFTLQTGSPVLMFNNVAGGGSQCEYADEFGMAMNDLPTSSFYINGNITNNTVPPAGTITGDNEVCQGETGVSYSITPISNATSYSWTVPPGATIVSGANTHAITVDFSASAGSGTVTAAGVNTCGTGISSSLPVQVHPPPIPVITGSGSECAGSTEVLYMTEWGMTGYLWDISTGGTITSGQWTAAIRVTWNQPGQQSVMVTYTSQTGCNALAPSMLPVTVKPLPAPPVISYSNDTLFSSYSQGNQWYRDHVAIPGADSAHYVPDVSGYYTARVTQDGCTSDSSNSIYVLITGIREPGPCQPNLAIFPNPGHGFFTLALSYPCHCERSEAAIIPSSMPWCIRVYNSLGVMVFEKSGVKLEENSAVSLDLNLLPDGIYTVVLANGNQVVTRKMIKH